MPSENRERILFVTSNGTGLGHLTRAMAIARRLGSAAEASILTLSAAAPVAAEQGFHVEYFPSHSAPGAEAPRRWDRRLTRRIELLLDELRPSLLVFDGAHPYDGLVAVLRGVRRRGLRTAWIRRAMWREGAGAEGIYWSSSFDLVLEPGELAESEDRGLTAARRAEATIVPPILYLDPADALPREQAARELGLDPGAVNALVALGQGEELDRAVERSLSVLGGEPELRVAALESSLSERLKIPAGVVPIRATYPISRYYAAFDVAVAAAGYNAFHELIGAGVPTLFVPMPRQLDDQVARARWARESGVGEGVEGPLDPSLEERVGALLDPGRRRAMKDSIEVLQVRNGAPEAAASLEGLIGAVRQAPTAPKAGKTDRLAVSAQLVKRVGLRLPEIVVRRAVDRLRNPPPAAAKVAVAAFGLGGAELLAALGAVSEREGLEPGRILAITDSLEFAALRRAGYGFEYVPDEARAAPVLEARNESHEAFKRRRVAEAMVLRRTARRVSVS